MDEQNQNNLLEGTVASIIYQNEENGYTILRLEVRSEEITVVGAMPGVSPGEQKIQRAGVFQFSPEEGTLAAAMENQVDADVAQRRVELVVDLQSRVLDAYNEERLGSVMEVLCEGFDGNEGCYVGRTYADSVDIDGRVLFTAAGLIPAGEFVRVRITDMADGDLIGEIED